MADRVGRRRITSPTVASEPLMAGCMLGYGGSTSSKEMDEEKDDE